MKEIWICTVSKRKKVKKESARKIVKTRKEVKGGSERKELNVKK
jgi:hypothetical protein